MLTALSGIAATLSGCTSLAGSGPTPSASETPTVRYARLREASLYLDESVERTPPPFVTVVEEPTEARLAVLAEDTSIAGGRVVEWLHAGVGVAMVGIGAHERLFDLLRAGDVDRHFDGGVIGVSGSVEFVLLIPSPAKASLSTGFVDDVDGADEWLDALEWMEPDRTH